MYPISTFAYRIMRILNYCKKYVELLSFEFQVSGIQSDSFVAAVFQRLHQFILRSDPMTKPCRSLPHHGHGVGIAAPDAGDSQPISQNPCLCVRLLTDLAINRFNTIQLPQDVQPVPVFLKSVAGFFSTFLIEEDNAFTRGELLSTSKGSFESSIDIFTLTLGLAASYCSITFLVSLKTCAEVN